MENLIKRARKGDKDAFCELMQMQEQMLYKVARTRLESPADIADAIQNTLIAAYQNIGALRQVKYFRTWLVRILMNACNAIYHANDKVIALDAVECEPVSRESTQQTDLKLDFERVMALLPFEERQALTLFYMQEFSIKQIGELMQMNENTVKTKLRRGKERLRGWMQEGYYE